MNSLLSAIKAFVVKNRPAYKDDLGNGKYDIKKLPEECVPDSVIDNIRKAQSVADEALGISNVAFDNAKSIDEALTDANVQFGNTYRGYDLRNTVFEKKLLYAGYFITGYDDIPQGKILKLNAYVKNSEYSTYATILNRDYIESFVVGDNTLLADRTTIYRIGKDGIIIGSSTPDSIKKFKITVDDTGTISATEVT